MNSKKIRKFVKKVVETTSAEKYADLMERLGSLNCYIDDNRDHLTDGTGYEILEKYFGESVMDDPEEVNDMISYMLLTKLTERTNDVFETYKLIYAMKLCGNNNIPEKFTLKNVKFVWNLLEASDSTNDGYLFEAAKMLEGFTFD